jgi:transposase
LEHPVRAVWTFAAALDLQDMLGLDDTNSAPPGSVEPALLVALWLWAAVEGVGGAGHLEKLCAEHLAYRWLCGGVGIDRQTLLDFRLTHGDALDRLLGYGLAALIEGGALDLELVSLHVAKPSEIAATRAAPERLNELAAVAMAHVQELRKTLDRDDPIADEWQNRTTRGRLEQQQTKRVNTALALVKQLSSGQGEAKVPSSQ